MAVILRGGVKISNIWAIGNLISLNEHNDSSCYWSIKISTTFGKDQKEIEHFNAYKMCHQVSGFTVYLLDYDTSTGSYYVDSDFLNYYKKLDFIKDTEWLDLLEKPVHYMQEE